MCELPVVDCFPLLHLRVIDIAKSDELEVVGTCPSGTHLPEVSHTHPQRSTIYDDTVDGEHVGIFHLRVLLHRTEVELVSSLGIESDCIIDQSAFHIVGAVEHVSLKTVDSVRQFLHILVIVEIDNRRIRVPHF